MQEDGSTDEVGLASFHQTFYLWPFYKNDVWTLWASVFILLYWHAALVRCCPKKHMHNTKQNQGFCKEFRVEVGLLGLCCKEKEERGRIKSVDISVKASEQQII